VKIFMATKSVELSTPINIKVETPAAPTSKYYPINFDATTARFNTEATSENIVFVIAEKAGHLALAVLTALVETLVNAALLFANAGIFTVESVKDLFAKEEDLPVFGPENMPVFGPEDTTVFEGPKNMPLQGAENGSVSKQVRNYAFSYGRPVAKFVANAASAVKNGVVNVADATLNRVLSTGVRVAGFATSHKAGLAAGTATGLATSALGLGAGATYSGAAVGALQFAAVAGNPILAPLAAGTALAVGAGLVANRIANRA
jgi:hypothetical protein